MVHKYNPYNNPDMSKRSIVTVVTGGAGFIGANLCRRLLMEGHIVICVDNLYSGKRDNIRDLETNPNFYFQQRDVCHRFNFPRIDQIYHLACPASPTRYQANPLITIRTGVIGLMNMLDLAVRHKCPLLFTSTSEVYGDPLEHPQKETYWGNVNCVGERSCYDESKRMGETLVYEYRKQYGIDAKIVRIFNTYGPYMDIDDGRVVTNFIKAYINRTAIPIYGKGEQTRSFCYVDDMVEGLVKMMNSKEAGPINLGNPNHEFTMLELAGAVEKVTGTTLSKNFYPLPKDDPKQRRPDITIANEKLGWEPSVSVVEGIEKTVNYFKQQRLTKSKTL
jgi:UDP-glucuronate decarboxylase